jgi:23S rRNA G2445 N2-methylase RlmL
LFATCVPGLAPLVEQEAASLGIAVTATGFDGRSDLTLFQTGKGDRSSVLGLRTTEDVFIEVGRASRADGDDARSLARRVWRPEAAQRGLSVWAGEVRPLTSSMTFRVIARVLQERSFLRTDLRRALTDVIAADRPKWRVADPAQIELWTAEYRPGEFVAGLRLTDVRMRQHDGRQVERPGALRPTVAAAMVMLAGKPAGTLLDPCCGSGTILAEAVAHGWTAMGRDIDPAAVDVARMNVPQATIDRGDARTVASPDESVAACVSNLPFGRQYGVQGSTTAWLASVLGEIARVTRPASRIVLLVPRLSRTVVPKQLLMSGRYPVQLLGMKTTMWVLDRR